MKMNIGKIERAIRIVAGLAILSALVFVEGNARWWGLIGIIPLATGVLRWCPAYALLGIDSCGAKRF